MSLPYPAPFCESALTDKEPQHRASLSAPRPRHVIRLLLPESCSSDEHSGSPDSSPFPMAKSIRRKNYWLNPSRVLCYVASCLVTLSQEQNASVAKQRLSGPPPHLKIGAFPEVGGLHYRSNVARPEPPQSICRGYGSEIRPFSTRFSRGAHRTSGASKVAAGGSIVADERTPRSDRFLSKDRVFNIDGSRKIAKFLAPDRGCGGGSAS
jgi:hypothetical protein